jgi:hypothetical protein
MTYPVNDTVTSDMFAGYKLSDATLDQLVDEGYDLIMFVDPNRGRYLSSIEDWQEFGVADGWNTHLRQSRMDRL